MKIGRQCACLLFAACALVSQASAQTRGSAPGTLKGVVRDEVGAVIEGTLVRIVSWRLDDKRKTVETEMAVHTDANGQFKFELAPGIYDLFVSNADFSPAAKQLRLEAGRETVFNPKLKFGRFVKLIP
jgi:hypothetical protein